MLRRTTWIFLAIFVALVLLTWWVLRKQDQVAQRITPTPAFQALFTFGESEIAHIRLISGRGNAVELTLDSEGSWIASNVSPGASDSPRIASAVQGLLRSSTLTTVDPAPNPADVGLDASANVVEITLADGQSITLRIGGDTPILNGYYAQVRRGPVIVVSQSSIDPLLTLLDDPPLLTVVPTATVSAP